MDSATSPVAVAPTALQHETTSQHIRGSSVLLVGRVLSLAVNFAVQVMTVRYLSKSDYGAFAYALSIVNMGAALAMFGFGKSITRFVPIYQEQRDYGRMFGAILLMFSTTLLLGLAVVLAFYGFQGLMARSFSIDPEAIRLLLILILLSPVQGLDNLLGGMLAIFASPRAIFFRKHLLGPGLKMIIVLLLIVGQGNVYSLAIGYVAGSIFAVVAYAAIVIHVMGRQGLLRRFATHILQMPAREVFSFTMPLLASEMVVAARSSLMVVLLEYFRSTVDVAAFRAAVPVAGLNMVVLETFTFLFMPMASRLFARNDREGINDLYWQTAIWMTIIAFPIFVVTFSLAQPLTLILYEQRYADSAIILTLLSLGYYLNTALGFNSLTLRVYGKVRYLLIVDLISAAASVGLSLVLIPRYGALGAAIGFCATMLVQNIFYQVGLKLSAGIEAFRWRYLKVYLTITLGIVGLWLIQTTLGPAIYVSFALAALTSLLVILLNRGALKIGQTFPELRRLPLGQRLFGE